MSELSGVLLRTPDQEPALEHHERFLFAFDYKYETQVSNLVIVPQTTGPFLSPPLRGPDVVVGPHFSVPYGWVTRLARRPSFLFPSLATQHDDTCVSPKPHVLAI